MVLKQRIEIFDCLELRAVVCDTSFSGVQEELEVEVVLLKQLEVVIGSFLTDVEFECWWVQG